MPKITTVLVGLLLVIAFIPSLAHAADPSITPINAGIIGWRTGATDQFITFDVHNRGDILEVSAVNINNGGCNNHFPQVTDSQLNIWTRQVGVEGQSGAFRATTSMWTTTASASGSITIDVHYNNCNGHGSGATSFDMVGYTLAGLQIASMTGTSGSSTSVPIFTNTVQSGIIGAFAAHFFQSPASTDSGTIINNYADGQDIGDSLGFGGAFHNGLTSQGFSSTYTMNQPPGASAFDAWSEVVLTIPVSSSSTTSSTTSITTVTTSTTVTTTTTITTTSGGTTFTTTSTGTTVSSRTTTLSGGGGGGTTSAVGTGGIGGFTISPDQLTLFVLVGLAAALVIFSLALLLSRPKGVRGR